jgi:hypothetical protein
MPPANKYIALMFSFINCSLPLAHSPAAIIVSIAIASIVIIAAIADWRCHCR